MDCNGAHRYGGTVRIVLTLLSLLPFAPGHLGSGDDVQPRDTVSVVTSVSPALPAGVRVSIVGGDTFLRIESDGVPVEVHGYDDEQYLRISVTGRVEVNVNSTTSVLNQDRYGSNAGSGTPTAPKDVVEWHTIATDGIAMWHDHRIHWMSPSAPHAIDASGRVQDWNVPLVVDGHRHLVAGTLYLRDRASILWWALAPLAAIAAFVLSRSRRTRFVAVSVGSIAGLAVGLAQYTGLPDGARVTPLLAAFSAGALVLCALAWTMRRNTHVAVSVHAGAAAALMVSAWMNASQVRAAYLPGLHAGWPARATIAMMLGAGLVAVVDGVARVLRDTTAE